MQYLHRTSSFTSEMNGKNESSANAANCRCSENIRLARRNAGIIREIKPAERARRDHGGTAAVTARSQREIAFPESEKRNEVRPFKP